MDVNFIDPNAPQYNRVLYNKGDGPKYNIKNKQNNKCTSGWCLGSHSHRICKEKNISLADPDKTCADINMIPLEESDCLKPETLSKVKNITSIDSRFSNINYGTIQEESKEMSEIPKGCQFYVDPNAPQYNRVLYNKSSGPKHNQPGVTNSNCTSGWCLEVVHINYVKIEN